MEQIYGLISILHFLRYDPITGNCNSTQTTFKPIRNLSPSTTYEWRVKVWYCSGGNGGWAYGLNFTTLPACPNIANLTVSTPTTTKATFTWNDNNGVYSFVRLKAKLIVLVILVVQTGLILEGQE